MKTSLKFIVNSNNTAKATPYEQFIAMLALRGYEFAVKRKWVSSVCREFTVTVTDLNDDDAEWAVYRLGARK